MKKRWIRIYPSYFFIAAYGYFIESHLHRTANFLVSLTLLNLVFGLPFIMHHLWSLGAEWVSYILYPLILKFTRNARSYTLNFWLLLTGIILLYIISVVHWREFAPLLMLEIFQGYACLFKCLANYIIGIATYGIFEQKKLSGLAKNEYALVIVILLLISLIIPRSDLLTIGLFVLLIISISVNNNNIISQFLSSKIIYFFGEISYPLYLINFLIFLQLDRLLTFATHYVDKEYVLYSLFAAFISLTVVISYFFHIWIEKPLIQYFNSRLYKTSNA